MPRLARATSPRAPGMVVAWMPVSRRSETLARRLGFELVLVGRPGFRRPWTAPLAYPWLAWRTISALVRARPRAVVAVAPPFVAPLLAVAIGRAIGATVAVDIHTGALLDRRWRWSVPILAAVARRAAVAIVTLPRLARTLTERGVRVLVVPDPLPAIEPPRPRGDANGGRGTSPGAGVPTGEPSDERPLVVAICGWGADEPIEELVAAADDRPWRLAITGRGNGRAARAPNVELTGFLEERSYVELVGRADAVIVLTTRDDTILSGAWEAIALGRPLVLSATPALVSTFGDGPVWVDPTAASIAAGIEAVLADPASARSATETLAARFRAANGAALDELAAVLTPARRR